MKIFYLRKFSFQGPSSGGLELDPSLDISFEETDSSAAIQEHLGSSEVNDDTLTDVSPPIRTDIEISQSESRNEPKRLPSIIKPTQKSEPIRKEHSVRFSDEGREMISLFEQQKKDMENLLKEAREEYQSQLEELKNNQIQIMKETSGVSVSTVNTTVSDTGIVENILSGAERELAEIRAYQQKLLEKHSGSENSANESSKSVNPKISIEKSKPPNYQESSTSDRSAISQSEASTSYHSIRMENHIVRVSTI